MAFPPPFPNPLLARIPSQPTQTGPFVPPKFGFFSPQRQGAMLGMPMFRPRFRPNFVPREPRPPNPTARPTGPPTTTTVFIGNISDKCPDRIIQEVIKKCGSVCNWKRLQDSSGKFKAFGFCDFMYPDGAKKALSVLKDFPIGDKCLNVKADEQTEKMLEEFSKNKILTSTEESDDCIKASIRKFLEEEAPELVEVPTKEGPNDERKEKSPAGSTKSSTKGSRRSRSSSVISHRHKKKRLDKSSKRKKSRHHYSSSSSDESSSYSSASSTESKGNRRKKSNRRKSSSSEDSDEAEERRRLKKEVKEREESYAARLKKWEEREKRMAKLHDKEREDEKQRQKTLQKEAKKLRQFLEDYVDERDDPKYYRGSGLFQRKRNYEREREGDAKDRQEERMELEEIRKSIMEEKHEGILSKTEVDEEMEENGDTSGGTDIADGQRAAWESVGETGDGSVLPPPVEKQIVAEVESPTPMKKTIVTTLQQKPMVPLPKFNGVFQDEEEDEVDTLHQIKKKIKPFEITREDRLQSMTPEERKKMIKDLITRIPTDRAKLFAFELCWEFVDEILMEQRVRPWVNKKICEYIGEEELSLVSFICEKISNKSSADDILQDLSMVLDDEAEVFMVKLWRLIVYESEAKRLGLNAVAANSTFVGSNSTPTANR